MSIIWFDDPQAQDHARVGGKGANLGRLVSAGFPVPFGFTVDTDAYRAFIAAHGLKDMIGAALGAIDYADADAVTAAASRIRAALLARPLPDQLALDIGAAYAMLGTITTRCAVRSSGTAEDLAEASFAGMHDTYLDICGERAIQDAVQRCWASLWTARAISYRQRGGFDHQNALLAVVVQQMIEADVAGVMFTVNPRNGRVDEFIVNGSWGLGEAVVSGQVTPDEFALDRATLAVKRRSIATKTQRIVRATGSGTRTESVPVDQHDQACLSDDQVSSLGELGRAVMLYYDGLPQDIEWAYADGRFHLLQARDVTGVEITWDEDIDESFQRAPEQNDDCLWTNQWAAEFWNGAITPLHYSVRGLAFEYSNEVFRTLMGFEDIVRMRLFKYRRGTAYFNSEVDARHYQYILPPSFRAAALGNVHPEDRARVEAAPFDWWKLARAMARMHMLEPGHGIYRWMNEAYSYIDDTRSQDARWIKHGRRDGYTAAQLQGLSDAELTTHVEARMSIAAVFNALLWDGFFNAAPFSLAALGWMLEQWFVPEGGDLAIFQDLISGLPKRTRMSEESAWLWQLGMRIKRSDALRALFHDHPGAAFFPALEQHEEGRAFLTEYRTFLKDFGHRGHADRDMYYDRRCENPQIDYTALRAILVSDDDAPTFEDLEARQIRQRNNSTAKVVAAIQRQRLGSLKAEVFLFVLNYTHRFLLLRDDERWVYDRFTLAKKRAFSELGRRLCERGLLADPRDHYFLAKQELFNLFDSHGEPPRLVKAKIAARRRAFERFLAREEVAVNTPRPSTVVGRIKWSAWKPVASTNTSSSCSSPSAVRTPPSAIRSIAQRRQPRSAAAQECKNQRKTPGVCLRHGSLVAAFLAVPDRLPGLRDWRGKCLRCPSSRASRHRSPRWKKPGSHRSTACAARRADLGYDETQPGPSR